MPNTAYATDDPAGPSEPQPQDPQIVALLEPRVRLADEGQALSHDQPPFGSMAVPSPQHTHFLS